MRSSGRVNQGSMVWDIMRSRALRWGWERLLPRTASQASWARFLCGFTEVSFLLVWLAFV